MPSLSSSYAMCLSALLAGSLAWASVSSAAAAVPGGEGQVNIVAWAGYVERGESDKNYDWVTGFEKATGCKVNVKVAFSSDEMVALMNGGGFDLVTASGDASLRLVAGKTVQPVDISRIAAWKSIDPRLQNAPWHTVAGKHYGAPYQWGPNVLMYNTTVFKKAPTSWSVVFEPQSLPDGKPNKGRVQGYYGAIYIADAALYLKSHRPELKITDPYALNATQYAAALALLRTQNALVQKYWDDANKQVDDFQNEGVVAAPSWPFQVNTLQAAKKPVASVIPKEGVTGWADTTMLHAKAAHPNCAYAWINHSLDPKVQGDVAAWFGSNPAVPAACKASSLLGPTGCQTNGINDFARVYFWRTPTAQCKSGSCVPYKQWVQDFTAIKGRR